MSADVDEHAHLIPTKHDKVSLETAVATGDETCLGVFLEYAQQPLARLIDGIVSDRRPVGANKRDWRFAAYKDTPLDRYVLGFIKDSFGPEIRQTGRSPDLHRAATGLDETALFDRDVT